MYFTQEDYIKIESWLNQRTVKDTEFPNTGPMKGNEKIPIIQDGKNKIIDFHEFVQQVTDMRLPDFYNVTVATKKSCITLKEAVSLVPVKQRKLGLVITYYNEHGNWLIYQFKGTSLNQWDSLNYWNNLIQQALDEFVFFPDEEDITGVRDGNRTFLKLKDREYNPDEFSGMGKVTLRKNLVGTEACSIDDEDHYINLLNQDMIKEENTVYIIQYDFDLNGKTISIPKGCTLWFQGGSINNGKIYLQNTAILGAFELADMGNVDTFGKFNTGQVMTFSNNERQELRWWNGEEWLLVLDITDYNELRTLIQELTEKHNREILELNRRCELIESRVTNAETIIREHSSTISNHETRISKTENDITNISGDINSIENSISNIENNISNIENSINDIDTITEEINNILDTINQAITNLTEVIDNIDNTITNHIQQYIENTIIGTASVTVNGKKYTPDNKGNITLPDYPEVEGGVADSVKGTLTVKSYDDTTLGTYNGSKDVSIKLPSGGTADKVAKKLKFTGVSNAEYDGSSEVIVNIPESTAEFTPKSLTIKNANGEDAVVYNAKEDKEIQLKKLHIIENPKDVSNLGAFEGGINSMDVDLLKNEANINLSTYNYGSERHPIVLFAGRIYRTEPKASWNYDNKSQQHSRLLLTMVQQDGGLFFSINKRGTEVNNVTISAAVATFSESTTRKGLNCDRGQVRSVPIGLRCHQEDNAIAIQGIRTANSDNDSIDYDPMAVGGGLLSFNLIILGYFT